MTYIYKVKSPIINSRNENPLFLHKEKNPLLIWEFNWDKNDAAELFILNDISFSFIFTTSFSSFIVIFWFNFKKTSSNEVELTV